MSGLVPFNFFSDNWYPGRTMAVGTFRLDVRDKEDAYIIEAELPGVNKEEIDLNLSRERLTISVSREGENNEENGRYVHRERRFCSMSRSIHLGEGAYDDIRAKLENGILTIQVPKKAAAVSTKINIE